MTMEYGIQPPAYRLPDETRLGAVHLQVSDLNRSLDFYQQTMGLRVASRDGSRASLAPQGDGDALVWLTARHGVRPVPRQGLLGLYHFAILLPDRPALGRFLQHLSEIGAYTGTADHFVSESVYLTDPDGLGIEVYADRPRTAWRHHQRQLYMTTDRLDVRAVVASAGGVSWDGMPAGTVMGHVHLHVGDLDRAAAFYHAALGFDKVVWEYPGALFLSAGGYHHHLGTNTWSSGPPASEEDARLLTWEIVVPSTPDAAAAAASLNGAGYRASETDQGWIANDPWGTTLQLRGA
ncbi:MAG: VOC family protein [Vicinamibacterales bacterium]